MRVTFVLPQFNLTGGVRVVAVHAAWLARRGHHVLAVAPRPTPASLPQKVKSLLKGEGWPERFNPAAPSHFDGLPVERRYLDRRGPLTDADVPDGDAVVATWWATAPMVHALSPAKGAKVHFVQGYETYAGDPAGVDAALALPLAKVVVSDWLAGIMRTRFGQEPAAVVPNAVDHEQFHAPPRGKRATPTVGLFYAHERIKGTDLGFRAYELAKRRLPGLRLLVMSNAPRTPELPLPDGAEWVYQARGEQLRAGYARCDAWLWPSREEGFGLPLLEASACRTPVIATPAGAAPEVLANGGGVLVPTEDPGALAEAIVKVCSLPDDEWRQLSEKALAAAARRSWDDASRLFEEALERVAGVKAG